MTLAEYIEWFKQQQSYDCAIYHNVINVPWKKARVRMTYLTQPPFLFGDKFMMPYGPMFSAS